MKFYKNNSKNSILEQYIAQNIYQCKFFSLDKIK